MLAQGRALRVFNGVGGVVSRLGWGPGLDEAELIAAARRRTGLSDLGDEGFREGLGVLLASLEGEAQLTTLGRLAARTRIVGLLETRLRLVDHQRCHPEVADERVERPLFVLGLPRTGTTVLYGMLAADPSMRSPATWEVSRPFPPPAADDPDRIAAMDRDLARFRRIAPGIDHIHPLGARLPQECLALQAPQFASYEFVTAFPVPSYWTWLRQADLVPAYRFERQFLQYLQSARRGRHWILKTPGHLMWLDALLEVFPDAMLVQTHRDPSEVLASVSSLMCAMRSSVSGAVDPHQVGREQLDAWVWGLERTMQVRDRLPDDRVVDVRYEDTVRDPVGTTRHIYDRLGLEVTPAVEEGVRAYLTDNPRDKHGSHRYTLDEFGLDADEVDAAFAGYRGRFMVDA
ncbi:sulfotransferase family protein [Nitriliruptor alkaliphilus]|uniref:sulfotransferase family protein n=1 Tax=Nitriliruptor alkaliphilus TaxID=427918 RepID=UPI001FE1FB57|nr:sulfotransferase [Nitriliruptor alkaliphilus]